MSKMKILTDEILNISINQKNISSELTRVSNENELLKTAIKSQSEAITDIVLNMDEKDSYASKIKPKLHSVVLPKVGSLQLDEGEQRQHKHNQTRPRHLGDSKSRIKHSEEQLSEIDLGLTSSHNRPMQNKEEEEDWQKVKGRERSNKGSRPRSGNNYITGQSSDEDLATADRKTFLFVSRLKPDTKPEDVVSFVKGKKQGTYTAEKLNSRFPDDYASFKVGIPLGSMKEIYSSDFWPATTFVSKFRQRKRFSGGSLNSESAEGKPAT